MKKYLSVAALLFGGLLSSCGKEAIQSLVNAPLATSRVRFFNFGVSAPSVNFYANETKMTAVTSATGTEATTGVAYGGVGAGGAYSAIAPGQYTLTGKIAAATDKDLSIAPVAATIADGKYYSYYMSGIYSTATKTVDAFVVEDPVVPPTDLSVATVRFVNAISNANPMQLYARNAATTAETSLSGAVAYKGAGAFTQLPQGVYDLITRYPGAPANVITRTEISFVGGRVYTVTARGDINVAPTATACGNTNRTCLDNSANR